MQINFFFYFLFLNYANITHDRERKNDLFKHIIVKAHIENPRVYPIFAFDVSHFKRRVGEFSLILITRITTIFSLSNILQFHTILIISLVYIYIYLGILNTLQTILSRMNRSHRVDTYAKIVIPFLPYSVVNLNVAF